LPELQQRLKEAGLQVQNLVKSQKWPKLPDGGRAARFIDAYVSSMPSTAVEVEDEDLTDEEIDQAIHGNRLRFGMIETDSRETRSRQRRGQDRIHEFTVENYGGHCAVCDVMDEKLLIASHIVRWADAGEDRDNLRNVICLCRIHDALFEAGYWGLDERLRLVKRRPITSQTIRDVFRRMTSFRLPARFPPDPTFALRHRERVRLGM
jgi:hypothetical protein